MSEVSSILNLVEVSRSVCGERVAILCASVVQEYAALIWSSSSTRINLKPVESTVAGLIISLNVATISVSTATRRLSSAGSTLKHCGGVRSPVSRASVMVKKSAIGLVITRLYKPEESAGQMKVKEVSPYTRWTVTGSPPSVTTISLVKPSPVTITQSPPSSETGLGLSSVKASGST